VDPPQRIMDESIHVTSRKRAVVPLQLSRQYMIGVSSSESILSLCNTRTGASLIAKHSLRVDRMIYHHRVRVGVTPSLMAGMISITVVFFQYDVTFQVRDVPYERLTPSKYVRSSGFVALSSVLFNST
jgi:hypothetical protein